MRVSVTRSTHARASEENECMSLPQPFKPAPAAARRNLHRGQARRAARGKPGRRSALACHRAATTTTTTNNNNNRRRELDGETTREGRERDDERGQRGAWWREGRRRERRGPAPPLAHHPTHERASATASGVAARASEGWARVGEVGVWVGEVGGERGVRSGWNGGEAKGRRRALSIGLNLTSRERMRAS